MKKEIKEKWLTALRSDEYKQGAGMLYTAEGGEPVHCCLGVLVDTMGYDPYGRFGDELRGLARVNTEEELSSDFLCHVGLPHGYATSLMYMNDGKDTYEGNQQSFEQIADWIEENVK